MYVYCDNDAKVRAPYDAMGLMDRLGLSSAVIDQEWKEAVPRAPEELTYPCCRQALGELGEVSPHGGPETKCAPIGWSR